MTAVKQTSEEAVVKALASQRELTNAEIAAATGLGRSTVVKTLAALERAGMAGRTPGGREGGRRLPDRWSIGSSDEASQGGPSTGRLRPGQLDALVLDFIDTHVNDAPAGATAVAKALGRSAGAVGNCLPPWTNSCGQRQTLVGTIVRERGQCASNVRVTVSGC
jgi:biotin operon repressor